MQILGVFLIVCGALFIVSALVRIVAELQLAFRQPATERVKGFGVEEAKAFTDLAKALSGLPAYALSTLVGVLLIAAGERIIAGLQIFSWH